MTSKINHLNFRNVQLTVKLLGISREPALHSNVSSLRVLSGGGWSQGEFPWSGSMCSEFPCALKLLV